VTLREIDPAEIGIRKERLINVPAINHLQECAEIHRLIHSQEFCLLCKENPVGKPIPALHFEWYGRTSELLTILLQRSILGTESFLSFAVLNQQAQRGLVIDKTMRENFLNPFSLGRGGTADNYYNKLPALLDPSISLKVADPKLWEEVRVFYKETRNKIFHGFLLNTNDAEVLYPYIDMIRRIFLWIDTWFEDTTGTILRIEITRLWPGINYVVPPNRMENL